MKPIRTAPGDMEWLSRVEDFVPALNSKCPIFVKRVTGAETLPVAQRHDCLELNYMINGSTVDCIGSERVRRMPGTVSIIAPDVPHLGIELESIRESITVYFLPEALLEIVGSGECAAILERLMQGTTARNAIIKLPVSVRRPVEAALKQMLKEEKARQFGWGLALRSRLADVLLAIARWERKTRFTLSQNRVPGEWHALERALEYLHENFGEKIYARDLAAAIGMSETGVKKLFRRTVGTPWVNYLQAYRIHRACLLLVGTALTVTETGMEVGFDNLGHFSETFRRHTGTTASRYRNQSRRKLNK